MQQRPKSHTGNPGLFIVVAIIYIGILGLFAWQTWSFVDWLFPGDQLLMKLLTVLCFDIMALIWACLDLFYHHATKSARSIIRWAWAISFILSLIASIFYLVLESILRFHLALTPQVVDIGYGVTIVAVTETVLFVTFWLYIEWSARHPHGDDFEYDTVPMPALTNNKQAAVSTPVQQQLSASSTPSHDAAQRRYMQNANVRSILDVMDVPPDHMDEVIESLIKKGVLKPVPQEAQTSPLAMPDLTKANQNGTNGTH